MQVKGDDQVRASRWNQAPEGETEPVETGHAAPKLVIDGCCVIFDLGFLVLNFDFNH